MINNILDLKNRTFAESNTLKSLILQSNSDKMNLGMDDIILHDYQIANSISLNSILSNFLVNIKNSYEKNFKSLLSNSYFSIIDNLNAVDKLDDQVKLFLYADSGKGTFYSKDLKFKSETKQNVPGTLQFFSMDSIWYSMVYDQVIHNIENNGMNDLGTHSIANGVIGDELRYESSGYDQNGELIPFEYVIQYHQVYISRDMTDMNNVREIFGYYDAEPFDMPLYCMDGSVNEQFKSINDFIKKTAITNNSRESINSIVLNPFLGNKISEQSFEGSLVYMLCNSRYLLCTTSGLYGLKMVYNENNKFIGFCIMNLGGSISNLLGKTYEYVECRFISINDITTLFVVCIDEYGKYHYMYMNENSFDEIYGFNEIKDLTSDGFIVPIWSTFSKVEFVRSLDNVNIVMTDHGFWDIEANTTNDIVYSYRGMKRYEDITVKNVRKDKIIFPTSELSDTDRIVEYDRVLVKNDGAYQVGQITYPDSIYNGDGFVGANENFAIYSSGQSTKILIPFERGWEQFSEFLFGRNELNSKFVSYLYTKVVNYPSQSEYYLDKNHQTFIELINNMIINKKFDELMYQSKPSDGLIPEKITSVRNLVDIQLDGQNDLQKYCSELMRFVTSSLNGFIDIEGQLKTKLYNEFIGNLYRTKEYLDKFSTDVVDALVSEFPLLDYFSDYLFDCIKTKLSNVQNGVIEIYSIDSVISDIVSYIRSKISAMLVIGGYNPSNFGNEMYPGIDSYIKQRILSVDRQSIQNIITTNSIKDTVVDIVKTAKIFSSDDDYSVYDKFKTNIDGMVGDGDLFSIVDENGFISKSGLMSGTMISVDWTTLKHWIQTTNVSNDAILKNFVKTQFYRPLYFNAYGYGSGFSTNTDRYFCETSKFYYNHNGILMPLNFESGSQIDAVSSGLSEYGIQNIQYSDITNKLSYEIFSDDIQISNDRFSFNGTEYYVVRNDDGRITSVYYNRYNDIDVVIDDISRVDSENKFILNGVEYSISINNGVVVVKSNKYDGFIDEFVKQISDEKFELNGIQYILEKDEFGYKFVRYNDGSDTTLVRVLIDVTNPDIGIGMDDNIEFRFNGDSVKTVNHYQCDVVDRIAHEWCEIDDTQLKLDNYDDFESILAQVISDLHDSDKNIQTQLESLSGILFDGSLNVECDVEFENMIDDGIVSTIMQMSIGGFSGDYNSTRIEIGNLIDGNCNIDERKVVSLPDGSVSIIKNLNMPQNPINMISVNGDIWRRNVKIIQDENISVTRQETGYSLYSFDDLWVSIVKDDQQYYTVDDGKSTRLYRTTNNVLSFVVGGERYFLNLETSELKKLVLSTVHGTTLDFSTKYSIDMLKNQLLQNLKQYMLNEIVQSIIDNGSKTKIDLNPNALDCYVDMFADSSNLQVFSAARGFSEGDYDYVKFSQVYKNNIRLVDDSTAHNGLIYKYIKQKVDALFTDNGVQVQTIELVNAPSIEVKRNSSGSDVFSYKVRLDLYLNIGKTVLENTSAYNNKFVIGNAIVRDLGCEVDITPKLVGNSIVYDVVYHIDKQSNLDVEWDQIVYVSGGRIKQRAIGKHKTKYNLNEQIEIVQTQVKLLNMPNELVSGKLNELLTVKVLKSIAIGVNDSISNDTRIQVGYTETINGGKDIWEFGVEPPEGATKVNTGRAIIQGNSYVVSNDSTKLIPINDGDTYEITKLSNSNGSSSFALIGSTIFDNSTLVNSTQIKSFGWFDVQQDGVLVEKQYICLTYDASRLIDISDFTIDAVKPEWIVPPSAILVDDSVDLVDGDDMYDHWKPTQEMTFKKVVKKQKEFEPYEVYIGQDLNPDSELVCRIPMSEINNGSCTTTISIGSSENDQYGNDLWKGVSCSINLKIDGMVAVVDQSGTIVSYTKDETTTCLIENDSIGKKCYQFDGIPTFPSSENFDFAQPSYMMKEYEPIDVDQNTIVVDGSSSETDFVTISFKIKTRVNKYLILHKCDGNEAYLSNGLYVSSMGVLGGIDINNALNEPQISTANYGFALFSNQLTTETSFDSIEYKYVYFTIDNNRITSDGKYCPQTVNVLPYNSKRTSDIDIFDRYYAVGKSIDVTPAKLSGTTWSDESKVFILNRSSTTKGIKLNPTNQVKYQDLLNMGIPQQMQEKVNSLVAGHIKLDDKNVVDSLNRIKQFLNLILDELNYTFIDSEIASLMKFTYSVQMNFIPYSGEFNSPTGLFCDRNEKMNKSLSALNSHMLSQFKTDFSKYGFDSDISNRDYYSILIPGVDINEIKNEIIQKLYELVGVNSEDKDLICDVFGDDLQSKVRYINCLDVGIDGCLDRMYIFDNKCNLFFKTSKNNIVWYVFNSGKQNVQGFLSNCVFEASQIQMKYSISKDDDFFKFANRDFNSSSKINDAFAVKCENGMLYLSWIDDYISSPSGYEIQDIAYEQNSNSTYVIFKDDDLVYRYVNLNSNINILTKDMADNRIVTFHDVGIGADNRHFDFIYIDYVGENWSLTLFGEMDGQHDQEIWCGNPGADENQFKQYNSILIGDTLFNDSQLKFQNISKNKDMFDILDVNEVDGCYYGLFKDSSKSTDEQDIYTIFRTPQTYRDENGVERSYGVIQRLKYEVVVPRMFRSADDLYSLWVVARVQNGYDTDENGNQFTKYKLQLQEISVPANSSIYKHRIIDIQDIIGEDYMQINDVIMQDFRIQKRGTGLFVLTNQGFYRVGIEDDIKKMSIDSLDEFKQILNDELGGLIIEKHISEYHQDINQEYFDVIKGKINQFNPDFTVFNLIPTEFEHTQDVGVVPSSRIDDNDEYTDHRADSVVVSTDILQSGGMVVDSDTNPGFITAAVSNPATMYDDDTIFIKSQRNPSIEGTEFYDYIYDENGNELMDLYAIPFIYRINSNNTYDLYINIPTTRTKYLNRVSGTLNSDLTTQVLADDNRDRVNFMDQQLPNNLDESTTKLRIYIDRKFISVGNVELVEISGNSIPLQIYRDSVNDGLYDSIALESRWNGEVEEILEPAKDINKVMLEFECYGTDSQSIHITGKTLINKYLDDTKYKFG